MWGIAQAKTAMFLEILEAVDKERGLAVTKDLAKRFGPRTKKAIRSLRRKRFLFNSKYGGCGLLLTSAGKEMLERGIV